MNNSETISKFSLLPAELQVRALALLAFNLTIRAREVYLEEDAKRANAKLRIHNEIQHRITAHVVHLLESDEKRYPDDVLIRILCEHAQQGGIEKTFLYELEFAIERVEKDNLDKK